MMDKRKNTFVTELGNESCTKDAEKSDHNRVPRAERYDINTVVAYRNRGKMEWHKGVMKNVSISGVLICAESMLPEETAIELKFSLPVQLEGGEFAAGVLCRASVVRSWKCEDARGKSAAMVAARITHSQFLRRER